MISTKKLMKMATTRRKRLSLPRTNTEVDLDSCNSKSSGPEMGHFVIYTTDQKRYVFPLIYLNNIFLELLQLSEEKFGISGNGPIIFSCDAAYMDFVVSFIQRGLEPQTVKNALRVLIRADPLVAVTA